MKDRVPTRPGRIKLTFDNGTVQYATLSRADEPIEAGTPLNKATLMSDTTQNALGLNANSTVNDALWNLMGLASSSGSGGNGELEDYTFEVGNFTNAGAGWNTYTFKTPFENVPRVVCQAQNYDGWVEIDNVTKESFQYCLKTNNVNYTTANVSATVNGFTTTTEVVKSVTATYATSTSAKVIEYIAIEYGGDV